VPALFPWFIVLVVALVWVVVFHFVQIRLAGFDLRGDFFAGEPGFDEPVGQKQQLLDPDSVLDTCCQPGRMETSHQYHSLVERHRIAIWQEKNQNRESWIDGFPELSTAILSGPNHAEEVARSTPSATVVASREPEVAEGIPTRAGAERECGFQRCQPSGYSEQVITIVCLCHKFDQSCQTISQKVS
jgi:NAD-dependent glycerol-3-phosphate dehydrogenase-like protein